MLGAMLLREARMRAGLTQTELGIRAGLPANVISRWERGEVRIGLDRLAELVRSCGLQFDIALRTSDDSNSSLMTAYRGLDPSERLDALLRRVRSSARVQGREERFDPEVLLRALYGAQVRFVVIGGVAAALHGGPHPTHNLDIVPRAGARNDARLRRVLRDLGADEPHADGALQRWSTDHGDVHVVDQPAGTRGFDDLERDAQFMDLGAMNVHVASLADVVRSKDAVGRPNERAAVSALRELAAA